MWMSVVIMRTIYRIAGNFMGENYLEFRGYTAIYENISHKIFLLFYIALSLYIGGQSYTRKLFPAKIPILRLLQKFSALKKFCYAGMHTLNSSCMYACKTELDMRTEIFFKRPSVHINVRAMYIRMYGV